MSLLDSIMESPSVYKLWQSPFVANKFAPILAHNDLRLARRVLDVACGPGTNTQHFSGSDYLGIDLNERYIEVAKRRYGRRFLAVDAAEFVVSDHERFDFILLNSFLHHIELPAVRRILSNLNQLLTGDGHVHILELALPERASLARFMAWADRGRFARPREEWRRIFEEAFEPEIFEPYSLGPGGVVLWNMLYFRGKKR